MELGTTQQPVSHWRGGCLAVGVFEDQGELTDAQAVLDAGFEAVLGRAVVGAQFSGHAESHHFIPAPIERMDRLLLVGLGTRHQYTLDRLRRAAATVARAVKDGPTRTLALALPPTGAGADLDVQATVEGFRLAMHEGLWLLLPFRFKSGSGDRGENLALQKVEIFTTEPQDRAVDRANRFLGGILLSRELVAAPANLITPEELVKQAEQIAAGSGFHLQVLDEHDCRQRGMGAFLAAARGGASSRCIILRFQPECVRGSLAVVGLGVTYNPDGFSRHGPLRLEGVKYHMGGAGSVLGAAKAIGELRPRFQIHFVVPAFEIASDQRLRPADLVTALNGKTIEVNDHGAEARLAMADALTLAEQLGADAVVDVATLTDNCVVALGNKVAGLWCSDDQLGVQLLDSAEIAGEPLWRMPLFPSYANQMRSPFADTRSTGPDWGEAISAAVFLSQFVEEAPWAHLDISGPVWSPHVDGYYNAGATGFGVSTIVTWIMSQNSKLS